MEVPEGYTDASDEMKRAYLTEAKSSEELVGMIRALLDTDRSDGRNTAQLRKGEKAEIYTVLYELRGTVEATDPDE